MSDQNSHVAEPFRSILNKFNVGPERATIVAPTADQPKAGGGVPETGTEPATFAESMMRCAAALKKIEALLYPKPEPEEQEELLDEPGPQIENFFGADRYV